MSYGYLVKNSSELCFYYYKNSSLEEKRINAAGQSRSKIIAENINKNFYVGLFNGKQVVIVVNSRGEAVMLADGESRVINKGGADIYELNMLMSDSVMRFIYADKNSIKSRSNTEGETVIDSFEGTPYRLYPVVDKGYLLIYKARRKELELCCRELTASNTGEYKCIYKTTFDIGDSSVCTDDSRLHFAFAALGRFSVRVVYACVEAGSIKYQNLWEGNKCNSICIAVDSGNVYVWWESGGYMYETVSNNSGESFMRCKRTTRLNNCLKALFLAEGVYNINELLISESGDIYAPEQIKPLIFSIKAVTPDTDTSVKKVNSEYICKINELKAELKKKQEEIDNLKYTLHKQNEASIRNEHLLQKRNKDLKKQLDKLNNTEPNNI